jgi:DNA anti-recombination protein RmuC
MQYLARIEGDFDRFKDEYDTLGGHIERARKKYDDTSKSLGRFGDKLIGAQDPSRVLTPKNVKALKRDSEDD